MSIFQRTHIFSVDFSGMLEIEVIFVRLPRDILNLALKEGSSKHGNARRAYVGEN